MKYSKDRAMYMSRVCLDVQHRHLVFTLPEELRNIFRKDRSKLNILFDSVKDTIDWIFNGKRESKRVDKSKEYGVTPGYIMVLHTFGRDLKWNPHIHVLLTAGGMDSRSGTYQTWKHLDYQSFRKSWKKSILDNLTITKDKSFYKIKSQLYQSKNNGFYVYAKDGKYQTTADCIKHICFYYVVRYTGRPVMASSRIKSLDTTTDMITYWYNGHETEKYTEVTEHVFEFIKKLIVHIPEKQFKQVRY